MIKLESVSKKYGSQTVLDCINFSAGENEFVSIIGKSGVGKTTLLSILAGMVAPDSGKIIFQNRNITKYNEEQLADFRLLNIGIVFQDFKIIASLSVYDNVYLAIHPRKDLSKQTKDEHGEYTKERRRKRNQQRRKGKTTRTSLSLTIQ